MASMAGATVGMKRGRQGQQAFANAAAFNSNPNNNHHHLNPAGGDAGGAAGGPGGLGTGGLELSTMGTISTPPAQPPATSIAAMMGPTLQVHNATSDQNSKRIVMALQSGMKSEITWALNTLTLLSFKEKDDPRKDSTPLAKIPGILDALLNVVEDWRNISNPREAGKLAKPRLLGASCVFSGFGFEYDMTNPNDPLTQLRSATDSVNTDEMSADREGQRKAAYWWCEEDGLFNLDDEGRAERQLCAVAASNVIRNFSFMPENEIHMAQHKRCFDTIVQCMEDHSTEDEELVTNIVETIVNLAPYLNLKSFPDRQKRAIEAIITMLESPVKAWHCSAAELLGRLVVNPDNEPYLLPFIPQVYKRLVDLLSLPVPDAQAAAVAALYNFAEVNMDCRLRLASERWTVGRLLKIIQAPHPLSEICRKAALTLENLASEPENRALLLPYEQAFAELAFFDGRLSDTFARILGELSSRSTSKIAVARGVWGS